MDYFAYNRSLSNPPPPISFSLSLPLALFSSFFPFARSWHKCNSYLFLVFPPLQCIACFATLHFIVPKRNHKTTTLFASAYHTASPIQASHASDRFVFTYWLDVYSSRVFCISIAILTMERNYCQWWRSPESGGPNSHTHKNVCVLQVPNIQLFFLFAWCWKCHSHGIWFISCIRRVIYGKQCFFGHLWCS